MTGLIAWITQWLGVFVESHYQWNDNKPVSYPYLTYTITTEQLDVDYQTGFYIDFDIFDNRGGDNERIEMIVEEMQHFYNNKDNRSLLTSGFLVRIEDFTISPFPTGSDRLQRRTGQFYLKIDWRN